MSVYLFIYFFTFVIYPIACLFDDFVIRLRTYRLFNISRRRSFVSIAG